MLARVASSTPKKKTYFAELEEINKTIWQRCICSAKSAFWRTRRALAKKLIISIVQKSMILTVKM